MLLLHTSLFHPDSDSQLLSQQRNQTGTISKINPVSSGAALFAAHVVTPDDPVEALRAGDGRREPDLPVRGLLVEDIGAVGGKSNVQNSSLRLALVYAYK